GTSLRNSCRKGSRRSIESASSCRRIPNESGRAGAHHHPGKVTMNRREQIKLSPDEQTRFLRECRKVSLATVDQEGFPHLVAMNFVAIDGTIYMSSYGKAQKVVNIRRNPKVAVMAESGKDYSQLRGVMIRGDCEIIEDREKVAELMAAIRRRDTGEAAV